MRAIPAGLITDIKGNLGGSHVRRLPDGTFSMARTRKGSGAGGQSPGWLYCQECVTLLDVAYRAMTYADKAEWGICPRRIHGHRLSHLGELYHINIPRMLFGMPGLTSPPDKFKSKKEYRDTHDAYPGLVHHKRMGVWVSGTSKDDSDFDPETGPIAPPWVPTPPEVAWNCWEQCDSLDPLIQDYWLAVYGIDFIGIEPFCFQCLTRDYPLIKQPPMASCALIGALWCENPVPPPDGYWFVAAAECWLWGPGPPTKWSVNLTCWDLNIEFACVDFYPSWYDTGAFRGDCVMPAVAGTMCWPNTIYATFYSTWK